MRVTQSMLSKNSLRNLNNAYGRMDKLQSQLATGSKLNKPSDDPVAATKGMDYRTTLTKNSQYSANVASATGWLDATDTSLAQVTSALTRVQELVTQAANDTNRDSDRQAIEVEIAQIRQQLRDVANTQHGDNYIFSGTKTSEPLFADTTLNAAAGEVIDEADMGGNEKSIKLEVYNSIEVQMNVDGKSLFKDIDDMFSQLQGALTKANSSSDEISDEIGNVQKQIENALKLRSQVGAKQNRVEMMEIRLSDQKINVTSQLSKSEDVDYAAAITQLTTDESIYRAALSATGKIIQPTLVDFL